MSTTSLVLWIMGMTYGALLAAFGVGMIFGGCCWLFRALGVAFIITGAGTAIVSKHFAT